MTKHPGRGTVELRVTVNCPSGFEWTRACEGSPPKFIPIG